MWTSLFSYVYVLITRASVLSAQAASFRKHEESQRPSRHAFKSKGEKRWLNSRHITFRKQIRAFRKKRYKDTQLNSGVFYISGHTKERHLSSASKYGTWPSSQICIPATSSSRLQETCECCFFSCIWRRGLSNDYILFFEINKYFNNFVYY